MFDANALLLSLLIGSVGFVCLVYGKKQARVPQMAAGVILMAYPYFVSSLWLMGGIGVLVLGAMGAAIKLGW